LKEDSTKKGKEENFITIARPHILPRGFLPEVLIFKFRPTMQHFNWQSLKDNFHNSIFDFDKKRIYEYNTK